MDQQQARLWLAIVLSMLVWLAYDSFVLAPARQQRDQTQVVGGPSEGLPSPDASTTDGRVALPTPPDPERSVASSALRVPPSGTAVVVETPLYRAVITPRGGRLESLELKRYRQTVDRESPALDLVDAEAGVALPLTVWIGSTGPDAGIVYSTNQTLFDISGDEKAAVVLTGKTEGGLSVTKTLTFDAARYVIEVGVATDGDSRPDSVGLLVPSLPATGGYSYSGDHAVAIAEGKLVEHPLDAIVEEPARSDGVAWAGMSGTYFAAVALPSDGQGTAVFAADVDRAIVRLDVPTVDGSAAYRLVMGPKARDILESYGNELERLVDLGWFWFIASPMLWLMHQIQALVGNYGVAIIVLTLLLKAVTFPLNQVSMKSMRKMQEIQPHLQKLRERHKDDPAAMQREMMELYKKHKVNPFSGCVPMLLQIPIFIGLYNGLLRDIELRHAPFMGWINDLSAPDRLHIVGIGVPVLTLLMGASMLLQQLTMPAQGDPNQRRIMMIMPVVFTFMFINFPSGLVLYWLVNNVVSIGQQYMAMRPSA